MSGLSSMCYLPGLGSDGSPCWPPSPAISYTSAEKAAGALAAARLCGGPPLVFDHLEELVGIGAATAAQDLVTLGVLDHLDDGDAEADALAVLPVLPGVGVDHGEHFRARPAVVLFEDRVAPAVEHLGLEIGPGGAANEGRAGEALVRLARLLRLALLAVTVEEGILDQPVLEHLDGLVAPFLGDGVHDKAFQRGKVGALLEEQRAAIALLPT